MNDHMTNIPAAPPSWLPYGPNESGVDVPAEPAMRTGKRSNRQDLQRLGAALATFYSRGGRGDRLCYVVAAVLFASGIVHFGVQLVTGGPWEGPVSWRKPTTFGLAFGLTLATLTWVTNFIPNRRNIRGWLLAVFAAACLVEVAVITLQAWRGVPSHFNVGTPLNASLAYAAAGGGALLLVTSLAFAAASARPYPDMPASMRLAVRAGFATFLAALMIGAIMIALGVIETRTVSQSAAYTVAAAFKPGHAATMHGILILPALAWLGSFANWTERRRFRVMGVACSGYVLAAGIVVVDAVGAVSPLVELQAPHATSLLAAAGLLLLLTAAGLTLAGLVRAPLVAGFEHA